MRNSILGAALITVTACAQPAHKIAPDVSRTALYAGWQCTALRSETQRVDLELVKAAKVQERAVNADVMSTLLIGFPVSGGGVKTEIAQLKGRRIALRQGLRAGHCG